MSATAVGEGRRVGDVADGLRLRGWAVDPASGREGPGEIVVGDGVLDGLTWLDGDGRGRHRRPTASSSRPGFIDLHAHFREPGNEDAETVATGLAAAAHGGFTTVCVMPNTTPALDEPGVLARVRAAAAAAGSPVRVLVARRGHRRAGGRDARGARRAGRRRRRRLLRRRVAGPVRGAPAQRARVRRARSGCRSSTTPRTRTLTEGAEANDGFVATVLGLRGWPVAAEAGAVARTSRSSPTSSATCRARGST